MTPEEITALRYRYDALIRERARIEEQLEDIRDKLAAEGLAP